MKKGQRRWTEEELILTINLYFKTTFGRLYRKNPDVIQLAELINRTPSAVAYKLVNFASFDPSLEARGIKGASNASKLDKKVWNDFYQNIDAAAYNSELLRAKIENKSIQEFIGFNEEQNFVGEEKTIRVKRRIKQSFFRKMILASYNETCCITGISKKELLIAGHIKPWSSDKNNRLNPQNGIAINSLHDKAFETGLITIDTNFQVLICSKFLKSKDESIKNFFNKYHRKKIILPSKFLPDKKFLEYHNDERFLK
ncbi:MAG: HNH endonuclease [Chitinophagales bacterium]